MRMSEFLQAMKLLIEKFEGEDIIIEELHVVNGEIQMSVVADKKDVKGDEFYEVEKKHRGNQRYN